MSPSLCYVPGETAPVKLPYCPTCQMPFAILVSTPPMHHVAECTQHGRTQPLPGMEGCSERTQLRLDVEGERRVHNYTLHTTQFTHTHSCS